MRQQRSAATRSDTPVISAAVRELRELERMVREGILSAETAQPAIDAIKRKTVADTKGKAEVVPLISPEVWRDGVVRMRDILTGDDLSAARDVMRELVDVVPVLPGDDATHVYLAFAASSVALMTGTGSRISSGSGGRI